MIGINFKRKRGQSQFWILSIKNKEELRKYSRFTLNHSRTFVKIKYRVCDKKFKIIWIKIIWGKSTDMILMMRLMNTVRIAKTVRKSNNSISYSLKELWTSLTTSKMVDIIDNALNHVKWLQFSSILFGFWILMTKCSIISR